MSEGLEMLLEGKVHHALCEGSEGLGVLGWAIPADVAVPRCLTAGIEDEDVPTLGCRVVCRNLTGFEEFECVEVDLCDVHDVILSSAPLPDQQGAPTPWAQGLLLSGIAFPSEVEERLPVPAITPDDEALGGSYDGERHVGVVVPLSAARELLAFHPLHEEVGVLPRGEEADGLEALAFGNGVEVRDGDWAVVVVVHDVILSSALLPDQQGAPEPEAQGHCLVTRRGRCKPSQR